MIDITEKFECCGCSACVQKCPKHCISLNEDNEGFLYPTFDKSICVDCGICDKVCPITNPYEERKPVSVLAAINRNEDIRLQSSSGGIFTILAENVIDNNGVVFGARYDDKWQVVLDYTETLDGLANYRGSKYLQARVENTFKQCEDFLKSGKQVIFSGSPCQISGLKHFLKKEYDNLLTVDFVCHGVPSPKVWRMYLDERKKEWASKYKKNTDDLEIKRIFFRDKTKSWHRFHLAFDFVFKSDGIDSLGTDSKPLDGDDYMKAFLSDMILRPSCHECKVRGFRSNSDITIADYWGIENVKPEIDDDKGVGLVMIHTQKGSDSLKLEDLECVETSFDDAYKFNHSIMQSVKPHHNRKKFFDSIDSSDSVISLIREMLKPTIKEHFKNVVLYGPRLAKRIIKKILK